MQQYGRTDLTVHCQYVAETDPDACTHCGECVERCIFDARVMHNGDMQYDPAACLAVFRPDEVLMASPNDSRPTTAGLASAAGASAG